jgi:hypothetical protein
MPGAYALILTVDGKKYFENLSVVMDPRVKTPVKDLQLQQYLSLQAYNIRKQISQIANDIVLLKARVKDQSAIDSLDQFVNGAKGSTGVNLNQMAGTFYSLHTLLQESDMPPTTQMVNSMKEALASFQKLLQKWGDIRSKYR